MTMGKHSFSGLPGKGQCSTRTGCRSGTRERQSACTSARPKSGIATDGTRRHLTFDMSGGVKAAKQALARPLDGMVRAESNSKPRRDARGRTAPARRGPWLFAHADLDAQPQATRGSSLGLSARELGNPSSVRKPARSALRAAHRARAPQRRAVNPGWRAARSTKRLARRLKSIAQKKALTFELSGRRRRDGHGPE